MKGIRSIRGSAVVALLAGIASFGLVSGAEEAPLVGGRGKQMPPELVRPDFSYPADRRSPFVSPEEAGRSASTTTGGPVRTGPLADDEVKAAVEVQVVLEGGQGRAATAIVSGQLVEPGKSFEMEIRKQKVELKVLAIDAKGAKVTFQYKGQTFTKAMGEGIR